MMEMKAEKMIRKVRSDIYPKAKEMDNEWMESRPVDMYGRFEPRAEGQDQKLVAEDIRKRLGCY